MAVDMDGFTFDELERENALNLLKDTRNDLKGEGYDDIYILQELTKMRNGFAYRATGEEWAEITGDLDPRTEEEKAQQEISRRRQLLEGAIESKDRSKLLTPENIRTLADLKINAPLIFDLRWQAIKDNFGRKLDFNSLKSHVSNEVKKIESEDKGKKPDVAMVAQDWATRHADTWAYDERRQCWRMWSDEYWQEQADKSSFLDMHAVGALQEANIAINSSTPLACFQRIAASHCKREFKQAENKINFANGTLDLDTMELMLFNRADNFTYCLPYNYDPHSKHPLIDKFLSEVLPDEHARLAFMAHGGLALLGDILIHQFFGMIGTGRCGKSTLLALLNALCNGARSLADAKQFAGASVFSRELEGKRARFQWCDRRIVCVDEMPAEALRDEDNLKGMSAHGGVEMRGIGKDEQQHNLWRPKLTFSTNDQPSYKDNSGAVKERAVFTHIKKARPVEERDPALFDKLMPELGAFAASCIELAMQVRQRGYYPKSKEMKMLLDQIACESNPLKHFVAENCALGPERDGYKVSADSLFVAFKNFCEENGHTYSAKQNKITFTKDLRMMNIGVEPKTIWLGGTNVRGLAGIRLRLDDDPRGGDAIYVEDEPLRKSARMMHSLNGCDPTVKATVKGIEPLLEQQEDTSLTVLTVKMKKMGQRETPHTLATTSQPGAQARECASFLDNEVSSREPLRPLRNGANGHLEPVAALTVPLTVQEQPLREDKIDAAILGIDHLGAYWKKHEVTRLQWKHEASGKYQRGEVIHPSTWIRRASELLADGDSATKIAIVEEINQRIDRLED